MEMLGWGIGALIVLLLFICLIFMIRHFYDSPACSMAEDTRYREILCNSAHRDFKASLKQLLEILDGIQENTRHAIPQAGAGYDATNQFYKAAKDIYNKCLQLEKTIREIWSNPKYTKDFYFFAGLHYTSRYLGNILVTEHQNLVHFLQACASAQETTEQTIEQLRAQRDEAEDFENRRGLNAQMEEYKETVKDLLNLRSKFSEIAAIYKERAGKQGQETNKRADFIATHFKRLGPEWKQTMSIHPRKV